MTPTGKEAKEKAIVSASYDDKLIYLMADGQVFTFQSEGNNQ